MSRFYLSCHQHRPLIAFSLAVITLAALTSTSSFQPSASSQTILPSASPPEPNATGMVQAETIVPPAWSILPCEKTHPVSCLYSNRGLVSHLEQEFVEQERSVVDRPTVRLTSEQSLQQNQATAATLEQPVNIDDISRKIRILIHLKNWLDTISPIEPIEQI